MARPPLELDLFTAEGDEPDLSMPDGEPVDERGYFADTPVKSVRSAAKPRESNQTSASAKADDAAHYKGHRERLRSRFRDMGDASLADYELLELLLFQMLPQRDTKPLAKALLLNSWLILMSKT